jgi:TPP-dependent pyruvate/acetoin dehydrogenase alpha subunit
MSVPSRIDPASGPEAGLAEQQLRWLRVMLRIREFETRCDPLALSGKIPGGLHSSAGQEGIAVGVAAGLEPGDHVAGTHRSHHHALASGIPADELMAELFGRRTGSNGGRGGSMHVASLDRGFIGGNGIVGAAVGLATGAALSAKTRGTDRVAVGFVGDGGANTGRTWESVNLAAIWKLPVIIVCENNLYAVETTTSLMTASPSIVERAAGFGITAVAVDGQDVSRVFEVTSEAVKRARAGDGPTFIEAKTYRFEGHNTGQAITYRTADEVATWRTLHDPITRLQEDLTRAGVIDESAFDVLATAAREEIEAAVRFAESSPWPEPGDALTGTTSIGEVVRTLSSATGTP